MKETIKLQVEELEERIAPSNANFPPGQFPSGNPGRMLRDRVIQTKSRQPMPATINR